MKKIFLFVTLITLLISCEEDVNLTVVGGDRKIVIEGSIENGKPPEVIVTRNSPLSQTVDFNTILVTDAKVYVSDGSITDTLTFGIDSAASIPFAYKGSAITGVVGQTYYLTVIADGQTFTSTTTLPAIVPLDSVWWKHQPPEDSLGYAWAHLSEPAGSGNAYKWYAKRPKDRRFIAPFGSTFDDKFIDGKSFDFAYTRGTDPTVDPSNDPDPIGEEGYYRQTDTIYIKFCAIDHNTSKFYITYESALQTNGNPFASPVTIISNINGGALGVWAGFSAVYDTILPKQ